MKYEIYLCNILEFPTDTQSSVLHSIATTTASKTDFSSTRSLCDLPTPSMHLGYDTKCTALSFSQLAPISRVSAAFFRPIRSSDLDEFLS